MESKTKICYICTIALSPIDNIFVETSPDSSLATVTFEYGEADEFTIMWCEAFPSDPMLCQVHSVANSGDEKTRTENKRKKKSNSIFKKYHFFIIKITIKYKNIQKKI